MKYLLFIFSIIIILLFINTAPPTIYLGDSGEIVTAALTLGIGHPPGYPLYILVGKIFTFIPLGDVAYRINLFASSLSVLSFLFLFLNINIFISLISKINNKNLIYTVSFIISLFYIFSETVWFEAINAKGGIYIFAHLIILLTFFSFFKFVLTKRIKYCYLSVYLSGFMIPAHNSTALFVIVAFFLNLYFLRKTINSSLLIKLIFFFLFSFFLSYLILFIRVKTGPVLDWAGITTNKEIFEHIIRKRYITDEQFSFPVILFRLNNYLIQFIKNYNILILLFLTGLYYIYNVNKNILFGIIVFFIVNTLLLVYGIETSAGFNLTSLATISLYISRGFYLINDLITLIISACGLFFLFNFLNKKYNINILFMSIIFIFLPIIMIFNNYELNNHSRKFLGYDHPLNIMKTIDEKNILFSRNDCPSFNILYIKHVHKKYESFKVYDRDMAVLDISIYKKNTNKEKMREIEAKFIRENINNTFFTDYFDDKNSNIKSTPFGILFKTYMGNEQVKKTDKLLKLYTIRDFFNNRKLDLFYRDFIAKYFIAKAEYYAGTGNKQEALKLFDFIEKISGKSPATLTELIRITYWQLQDIEISIKYLKKMVHLNPYDFKTLNILLRAYFLYNYNEALVWINEFYKLLPDTIYKKEVKRQIEILRQIKKDEIQ